MANKNEKWSIKLKNEKQSTKMKNEQQIGQ